MISQGKSNILYISSTIMLQIIPLLLMPLYTREIGVEGYGQLALVQIFAIFMICITDSGLSNIFERNFFELTEQRRNSLLLMILIFSGVLMAVLSIITLKISSFVAINIFQSAKLEELLLIGFASLYINTTIQYFITCYKNLQMPHKVMLISLTQAAMSHFFALILILSFGMKAKGVLIGSLASGTIIFLCCIAIYFRSTTIKINIKDLLDALKYSYPLMLNSFVGLINKQFDKYMINLMETVGGVGIYSFGQKISSGVFAILTTLENTYNPICYKLMFSKDKERAEKEIGKLLTPYIYLSVGCSLICMVFAQEAVAILATPEFQKSALVIIILAYYYSVLFFGKQKELLYSKQTKKLLLLNTFRITLNIGLNLVLINLYGVIGASIATLVTGIVGTSIYMIIAQKFFKISWEFRKVSTIYLFQVFLFGVSISLLLLPISAASIISKLLLLSMYLIIGFKIGVLSFQNKPYIKFYMPNL